MAQLIGKHMKGYGTKFIEGATPVKLEKPDPEGPVHVTFKHDGEEKVEQYDTVLFAIGRYALTGALNLEKCGVVTEKNGKINAPNNDEQTNVANIFAIGDVLHGRLELTPVAIKAGKLLARRLFAGATELMDYDGVPTTVFTPLEYGCCGLAEAEAHAKFGKDNITTYHTKFTPLEWNYDKTAGGGGRVSYVKVVCNKADNLRVVGFHICAPNAGEVTQGVAMAMKCGMTKAQMDSTVGIHPTVAEDTIGLQYNKEEHPDATKSSC